MPFHMCGSRNIYLTDWGFMKAACSAVPYKLYIRFTLIAGSSKNLQTTSDIYARNLLQNTVSAIFAYNLISVAFQKPINKYLYEKKYYRTRTRENHSDNIRQ